MRRLFFFRQITFTVLSNNIAQIDINEFKFLALLICEGFGAVNLTFVPSSLVIYPRLRLLDICLAVVFCFIASCLFVSTIFFFLAETKILTLVYLFVLSLGFAKEIQIENLWDQSYFLYLVELVMPILLIGVVEIR